MQNSLQHQILYITSLCSFLSAQLSHSPLLCFPTATSSIIPSNECFMRLIFYHMLSILIQERSTQRLTHSRPFSAAPRAPFRAGRRNIGEGIWTVRFYNGKKERYKQEKCSKDTPPKSDAVAIQSVSQITSCDNIITALSGQQP